MRASEVLKKRERGGGDTSVQCQYNGELGLMTDERDRDRNKKT